MIMPVVGIWIMGVAVAHRRVIMPMDMRPLGRRVVGVLVMSIIYVGVFVPHPFMAVGVLMGFA